MLCLDQIHGWQDKLLKSSGSRFVFAADEIYLRAQRDFPELEAYEDFAQIENGVGMIAQFRAQTEEVLFEAAPLGLKTVTLITGLSFCEELREFCHRLSLRCGTTIQLVPIRNDFFGPQITVTGLLTGADIISQLKGKTLGQALLVPDVLLRDGDLMLLDDLTLEDISRAPSGPGGRYRQYPLGAARCAGTARSEYRNRAMLKDSESSLRLPVYGMTCQKCVARVTQLIAAHPEGRQGECLS